MAQKEAMISQLCHVSQLIFSKGTRCPLRRPRARSPPPPPWPLLPFLLRPWLRWKRRTGFTRGPSPTPLRPTTTEEEGVLIRVRPRATTGPMRQDRRSSSSNSGSSSNSSTNTTCSGSSSNSTAQPPHLIVPRCPSSSSSYTSNLVDMEEAGGKSITNSTRKGFYVESVFYSARNVDLF